MARRIGLGSLAVIAIALLASAMAGGPQDPWAPEKKDAKFADVDWEYKRDPPLPWLDSIAGNGAPLYEKYCVACHGATGDGKGDLAPMLIPPPRDFTKGVFKGRSSHPEMPPTATDLQRSLVHGIPLSAMLSYSFIGSEQQYSLVAHVKNLAARHFPKGFGFPLKSGNFHRDAGMPFPTAETVARGKALFERLNCVACHGDKGDGRGRVVETLSDTDDGRPSNVRDFTQGIYSGGPNVRHMYLRVSGGVQGTVMPPFATSASVEDRLALAHYVMSLSKRSKPLPLPHSETLVVKKAEKLPKAPGDPEWAALEKLPLPPVEQGPFLYPIQPVYVLDLYFQQLRHNRERPYFTEATARALHDGESIAIRLEWEDTASNPADRIEIQLSPKRLPDFPGFVLYGSKDDPATLWRWESKAAAVSEVLDATGPFAVAARAASNVTASANYDPAKKRWAVVFTRSLAGAGGADAPLAPGVFAPFSVLMKDGDEAWPEGTRAIKADPEDSEADIKRAKAMEAARGVAEKAIEAKFKDLPRHLTTWHNLRLE